MTDFVIEKVIEQGVLFAVLILGMVQMYRHFSTENKDLKAIIKDKDSQLRDDSKELIQSLNNLTNAINQLIKLRE